MQTNGEGLKGGLNQMEAQLLQERRALFSLHSDDSYHFK